MLLICNMQKHYFKQKTQMNKTSENNFDEISRYSDECDCDAHLKNKNKNHFKTSLIFRFFNNVRNIFRATRMAFNYKKLTETPLIKTN